jgi:hypothetical protein
MAPVRDASRPTTDLADPPAVAVEDALHQPRGVDRVGVAFAERPRPVSSFRSPPSTSGGVMAMAMRSAVRSTISPLSR